MLPCVRTTRVSAGRTPRSQNYQKPHASRRVDAVTAHLDTQLRLWETSPIGNREANAPLPGFLVPEPLWLPTKIKFLFPAPDRLRIDFLASAGSLQLLVTLRVTSLQFTNLLTRTLFTRPS